VVGIAETRCKEEASRGFSNSGGYSLLGQVNPRVWLGFTRKRGLHRLQTRQEHCQRQHKQIPPISAPVRCHLVQCGLRQQPDQICLHRLSPLPLRMRRRWNRCAIATHLHSSSACIAQRVAAVALVRVWSRESQIQAFADGRRAKAIAAAVFGRKSRAQRCDSRNKANQCANPLRGAFTKMSAQHGHACGRADHTSGVATAGP